jgi:endonuclease G
MRAIILLMLLLPIVVLANPIDDKCPQFVVKTGAPQIKEEALTIYECHKAYAVLVSAATKDPIFVVEHLNKASLACTVKRANDFHPDLGIPTNYRSRPQDYDKSGYDQGHMASAEDFCSDATEMHESFLMSNMVPQDPHNNRGIWKHLETMTRTMAATDEIYVISGPIFMGTKHKTIGQGVAVPEKLFKVIVDNTTNTIRGWILPNAPIELSELNNYKATIDEIEVASGITIFPHPHTHP